jgi:short-subunit dehydrogenase
MKDLRKKLVLVTGSAGGIGLATACAFAAQGARLALMDVDGDRLIEAREQVRAASHSGEQPLALAVDLCDEEALLESVEYLQDQIGPVDVLVNNAGVCQGGPLISADPRQMEQLLKLNLYVPLRLSQLVVAGMQASGAGHIVNLYSSSATLATPGFSAYAASKAGLACATRILRRELSGSGIGLTLLCPGSVLTPMSEAMVATGKGPGALPQSNPEVPAAAIVDAVLRDRRLVMVSHSPLMQRLVVLLDKLFPALLDNYWIRQADADYYGAVARIGARPTG